MDLRRLNDQKLTRHYHARLFIGSVLILLLAAPSAFYAYKAINGLFNRPSDWIPTDMEVRRDFDDFAAHFSVTDLVLLSWNDANVNGEQLDTVATLLRPLCSEPIDSPELPVDAVAASKVAELAKRLEHSPLHWVHSGSEVLRRLTSSPINLSHDQAIKRLRGSLIGPDNTQSCLVLSLSEPGLLNRREVIPAIAEAVAKQLDKSTEDVHFVGGPYDGMVIDEASVESVQLYSPISAIVAAVLCFVCLRSLSMTSAICVIAFLAKG